MIRALALAAVAVLPIPAFGVDMATANGAELRVLDKLTGALSEVTLSVGQSQTFGKLTVQLDACRYPADNKTAEAEVMLTIVDSGVSVPVFTGWMIASSPALSALDHARYDVWALRCDVPEFDLPDVAAPVDEPAPEDSPAQEDAAQ